MKIKKFISGILPSVLIANVIPTAIFNSYAVSENTMRDISTMEIVNDMGKCL